MDGRTLGSLPPYRRRPVGDPVQPQPQPQRRPEPAIEKADAVDDLLDDYFTIPVSKPLSVTTRFEPATSQSQTLVPPPSYSDSQGAISAPTSPLPWSRSPVHSPGLTPATPSYLVPVTPDSPSLDIERPHSAQPASKPFWKTAIDETVHFAGGLVSHPTESTKHFTVLRHSPGLIFYKGPSTSITITIFSDDGPLPPGRTLWLQRKGLSGNMGMDASSFFRTDSAWIDVTPSTQVSASDVPPDDERTWQRDINKFTKRSASDKRLSKHRPCETCVVRVPAAAADGYMRIVICGGKDGKVDEASKSTKKKTLCSSPVFRVASTSRDMSVVRGASMRTLPLELGLQAATTIGQMYVNKVAGPAVIVAQAGMKRFEPIVKKHGSRAMAVVGTQAAESFKNTGDRYAPIRHEQSDIFSGTSTSGTLVMIVGSEDGPQQPFPLHMKGKVIAGTGRSRADTGFPTANLSGVSGDLLLRLNGVYFGWVALLGTSSVDDTPYKAIITIGPPAYGSATVSSENVASVHLIQEYPGPVPEMLGLRIDVIIMGYLRPILPRDPPPAPRQTAVFMQENINVSVVSLDRDMWHYGRQQHLLDAATTKNPLLKALKTHKSFSDFASHAGAELQKRVDSVPMHWAGVRTAGNELKDHAYGTGGFYVKR